MSVGDGLWPVAAGRPEGRPLRSSEKCLGYKNPRAAANHSMPIWIAPADTRRWLIATATGHLSLEDLVTFIMTHRTGERLRWPLLFDASATTTDIAPTEVEQLARAAIRAKEQAGEMRAPVALIAPADPASYMLMQRYQTLCDQNGIGITKVFRSREEAEQWLIGVAS